MDQPLTEKLAPGVFVQIEEARSRLEVTLPVEAYQFASGSPEVINASFWGHGEAVVLSFDGQLLGRFDPAGLLFFLGHELGHHLAHGAPPPWLDQVEKIYHPLFAPSELNLLLRRAHEFTADRFGLLACRDLDVVLRASVVLATNLPAAVHWEPRAYLDQCRAYVDALRARGEQAQGFTHPEHSLRSYAAWLFSESDLYHELTGLGSGRLKIEAIDRDLTVLLGLPAALSLPVPATPPVAPPPAASRPPPPAPRRPPAAPRPSPALVSPPAARPRPAPPPAEPPAEVVSDTAPRPTPRAPLPGVREDVGALVARGQASLVGAARAVLGRATAREAPPRGDRDEVDPLLDDERELLARFEALERKEREKSRGQVGG